MKVSKRDILLFIGFMGILAGVCSYLFVFQPAMKKADALELENIRLQGRILDLQNKQANKEIYQNEIARMEQEMKEIYRLFPVDVREENAILLAINQEQTAPLAIESVTIDALLDVPFLEEGKEDALPEDGGHGAGGSNPYGLKNRRVTMNYEVSYEGLKRSVKNICLQTERMVIEDLTVVYDETTGLLRGTMAVNMYCVPNQEGREYVKPDLSSVLLGTDNIFGSIVIRSESGLTDLESSEGQEDTDTAEGAQEQE